MNDQARIHMNKAHELCIIHRAWLLHMKSGEDYDAWENNFRLNQSMSSFMQKVHKQGSPENEASRAVIFYGNKGIGFDQYRDFVVSAWDEGGGGILSRRDERLVRWDKYKAIDLLFNLDCDESDFLIMNGMPTIMARVAHQEWSPLQVSQAISNSKAWDRLWSMREQSTFMFDIVWPKIHKYKPLFKG